MHIFIVLFIDRLMLLSRAVVYFTSLPTHQPVALQNCPHNEAVACACRWTPRALSSPTFNRSLNVTTCLPKCLSSLLRDSLANNVMEAAEAVASIVTLGDLIQKINKLRVDVRDAPEDWMRYRVGLQTIDCVSTLMLSNGTKPK